MPTCWRGAREELATSGEHQLHWGRMQRWVKGSPSKAWVVNRQASPAMATTLTQWQAKAPPTLAVPTRLHRQLLPHFQSLLEQQAMKGSSLWPSCSCQSSADKPHVVSHVLLMPLLHVLWLFHMGWDVTLLHPRSQRTPGLVCPPAVVHSLQCPWSVQMSSTSGSVGKTTGWDEEILKINK